ncbi:MAG: Eco57I restriction-modification methylase domain-containing protein, partial [Anaerolineae bacterium]
MPIPPTISDLIQRFDDNRAAYQAAAYNEAQVRQEFINPLFEALGWDVTNKQGRSEKYKAVIHEDTLRTRRGTKAPDYAFRIGGQRVFFVEAKKPSVNVKADEHPAYQLRRYAWSAKLPLSILTDFEEFAVYDCRDRPVRSDSAATARVMYFTYHDYPQRWDEIAGIFSPEAIYSGALDRYVDSTKTKRGTAEVDAAFLAEIEGWRDALARNLALRNPGLTVRQLNFAVQKTIDRLIFLRIAEDRGIEPYGRLRDTVQARDVYAHLGEVFRQADNRYDAGLFYFHAEKEREGGLDDFTLDLRVDDKVFKDIVESLYYPASPYQFDMLPADILGQVYEQFLGKVIRLTAGGRAKVEEKPEVKKAGGVYYTPTYIVDYIVEHTVGELLKDKTYRQVKGSVRVAPLRILDPACGSGTFLLQAYQYLLDWYLEQYVAEDAELHARGERLVRDRSGDWRLTSEERKEILLRHIYGVDIDTQAVEVTKLSLLLKVLEGEDEESLGGTQLAMSIAGQERVLPDLSANIRCGNSLIGSDYYQGEQLAMDFADEETMYRINAFDWDGPEGFPTAMAAGGFDAVIGNPP